MPWPAVAGTSPGVTAPGSASTNTTTYLYYGTEGLLQSPKPTAGYYTVTRFDQRQIAEELEFPNGNGIITARILLVHGNEFTITVRDDSRMNPIPRVGTTVTIVDAGRLLDSTAKVYSAVIVDNNYTAAPKQVGERNFRAKSLILIDVIGSGSAQV